MALRDQPYIPFFVQDFLTDEKLMLCSASATGVYIRLLCLMHKSEHYGKIKLSKRFKTIEEQISVFMPWDFACVLLAITELVELEVLEKTPTFLIQKRMVKDGELSMKRATAGSKGGKLSASNKTSYNNKQTTSKSTSKHTSKNEASTENEYGVDFACDIEGVSFKQTPANRITVDWFNNLWDVYPSGGKTGKKAALRHFKNSIKTPDDYDRISKALANYKISERVTKGFIQNGSTWFNNWEDWIDPPKTGQENVTKSDNLRRAEELMKKEKYGI